ncbi:MAG: ribonuclease D, partial [Planctomycetes bacterium]|nr:ribonuclease D [Planctomycetota bacterium]
MKPAARIAIDMEADSFYHYYEKVCLIQLTVDGENYILDPLAGANLKPFLKLLAQKPLILHDAGYDLRMLRASFDFSPKEEVFDTM